MALSVLTDRLRLPVIAAPMSSCRHPSRRRRVHSRRHRLVPRPQRPTTVPARQWLHQITEALAAWDRDHPDTPAAPFAVNQIVHGSNPRWEDDVATCGRWEVPIIISSLGARDDLNHTVHAWGGITLHDVINDRFARKAIQKGADGLIAVAAGAGGHAGQQSPFALVQEIRAWFDGPLVLSGRSRRPLHPRRPSHGRRPRLHRLAFIATTEANAPDAYKAAIVDATAANILYSDFFSGVHGNYLLPSIVAAGLDPDALPAGDLRSMDFAAQESGETKAWRDIWGSGQGVGLIDAVEPAGRRIARWYDEYVHARAELSARVA